MPCDAISATEQPLPGSARVGSRNEDQQPRMQQNDVSAPTREPENHLELETTVHLLRLAAHEIRAPLTRLKGYIELLRTEALDGRLHPEMLEHTLDRMNRAIDLVTGLVNSFTNPAMSGVGPPPAAHASDIRLAPRDERLTN